MNPTSEHPRRRKPGVKQWLCLSGAVLCGAFLLLGGSSGILSRLATLGLKLGEHSQGQPFSAGIIGGADGPTAILISGSPTAALIETGIAGILGLALLAAFLLPMLQKRKP